MSDICIHRVTLARFICCVGSHCDSDVLFRCRDVLCCLLFVVYWVGMVSIAANLLPTIVLYEESISCLTLCAFYL